MRETHTNRHDRRFAGLLSFSVIIATLSAPAAPQQPSGERDIEIPVADVQVIDGEVRVDIAYETKIIELIETLEMDLARLVKKASEKFPDSATIRLLISNRGEKVCGLEIPTEAAAQGARNALSDEAMLAQMKSEVFIDLGGRINAELESGEWPRLSQGTFNEQFLASLMEDEWRALEESPAEEAEEGDQGEIEPGEEEQGQEMEGLDTEGSEWWAESEGQAEKRSVFPPLRTVLIAPAAVALIVVAVLIIRKRRVK